MIRVLENQDKKLYYASSSDWECVVLATDAVEAAAKAFEEAFDTFGKDLNLSSCVNVINCSSLYEKNLIDTEHVELDMFIGAGVKINGRVLYPDEYGFLQTKSFGMAVNPGFSGVLPRFGIRLGGLF